MTEIEAPLKVSRTKMIVELDKKVFKVCEVRERQIGTLRKKFVYIHFDGKEWHVLRSNSDFSDIAFFALS